MVGAGSGAWAAGTIKGAPCKPSRSPRTRMCALMLAAAHLSASSRITILCRPGGSVTLVCANILILFRTTSMPLQQQQAC